MDSKLFTVYQFQIMDTNFYMNVHDKKNTELCNRKQEMFNGHVMDDKCPSMMKI